MTRRIRPSLLLLTLLAAAPRAASADEGMWTFNNFPKEKVKAKYGFAPDDAWLKHVQLSSARLARGCSGSFVSSSGLVMTNHHCAQSCIQQLSTADKDYIASGFFAKADADEVKCPDVEINQLVEISDVTDRVSRATHGLTGKAYNDAEKAERSRIEKECASSDKLRCDTVSLYRGGLYNLYKYRRFQDVRLVFAPEFGIAFFGGDPDNFNFPRYDLDVSFLRVYEDGQPAKMADYLRWSPKGGARENDLVFVSGNPGGTDRLMTVAELEYERDVVQPERLLFVAELRGVLTEFQKRGPEQKRISNNLLFGMENTYKALRGREEALLEKTFFDSKVAAERDLRAQIANDPAKKEKYGAAWDAIARALVEEKKLHKRMAFVEGGQGFGGDLFRAARTLVRAGDERQKPSDKRFRELSDARLPEVKQVVLSRAPIYDEFEILRMTFGLTKLREELGADDPFVKKVLGKESPAEMAERLVKGTKLKDVAERQRLWDGGKQAVDASDDPMIKLVRAIDPDGRAVRKHFEDDVEPVLKRNDELIARARFDALGTSTYPDATFTLRLSYGAVKGYEENGHFVKPLTTMAGAFERATGRAPFDLPKSWLDAKPRLTLSTPFDMATTNDIIGGNSGSPVVNAKGEVVGLVFDGNIQSLGGDFGYDAAVNRTVAVHSDALVEALTKVYRADRLVKELGR